MPWVRWWLCGSGGDGFGCGFLYICCSWWWWRVSVVVGMGDVGMVVADVGLFDYFLMGL